jgi:L-ascorbate metabolism protein UlaG (beta-lactamase superfamily)
MTVAHHSSQLPDGSYGGNPGGFVLTRPEGRIYFACDTALFSDMQQIGAAGLELAVLPIGDLFTMGPERHSASSFFCCAGD